MRCSCSGPSWFWFLPATKSREASIKITSSLLLVLRNSKIAAGMPVPKNSFSGRPITASSRFSSISAWRILPSLPPRNSTPWGTTTPMRPLPGFRVSIICRIKA
ncbi:hypothetical protein D3C71_1774650 [compost metagenome]